MVHRKELSQEQVLRAIDTGEFDQSVTASTEYVVVVMSQSWCPQWKDMKSWIYTVESGKDLDVYELIYNQMDLFDRFKDLKENRWENHQIPYLRFYLNGTLNKETNYISRQRFQEMLEL